MLGHARIVESIQGETQDRNLDKEELHPRSGRDRAGFGGSSAASTFPVSHAAWDAEAISPACLSGARTIQSGTRGRCRSRWWFATLLLGRQRRVAVRGAHHRFPER
eukprot:9481183-Pyramimonas_sp.AAC.1